MVRYARERGRPIVDNAGEGHGSFLGDFLFRGLVPAGIILINVVARFEKARLVVA